MTQRTQRKNVRIMIDPMEDWKVSTNFSTTRVSRPPFTRGEVTDFAKQRANKRTFV